VRAVAALADVSTNVVRCWTREAVGGRRAIELDHASIGLLQEAVASRPPEDSVAIAALVKSMPVVATGTIPIDRAISTAGGIAWSEVDEHLLPRHLPGTFVAGVMLD
jgi:predicted flavoprotein YhiN